MSYRRHPLIRALIHPDLMYFSTIWMMILLVVGTLAEKYVGLYLAQKNVFLAWIMWWGFVPMPGGLMAMAAIGTALLAKTIFASEWSLQKSGIILVHAGALLLLGGGVVTSLFSEEGSMVIYEGETVAVMADYHDREFVIIQREGDQQREVVAIPYEQLTSGQTITIPSSLLAVDVVQLCRNCTVFERKGDVGDFKGRAAQFDMAPAPLEKQDEVNKTGIQFRVRGADAQDNGTYFSMDFIDAMPKVRAEGHDYSFALRKRQTVLPFALTLEKFDQQFYPATGTPRSYRSDILVQDGGLSWRSVVEMNQPLRYRGYTFFQSSFIEDGERKATVLAVVKNAGRMFPYIACGVIGLGLFVHMVIMLPRLFNRKNLGTTASVFLLGLGLMLSAPVAMAADAQNVRAFDLTEFAHIPILDQGRIKPLSSFAETALHHAHGGQIVEGLSATAWLAEVLCNPDRAYDRALFKIRDSRVRATLRLQERLPAVYSFREVAAGIETSLEQWREALVKPAEYRSDLENELVDVYEKAQNVGLLSRSLSIVFPDFLIDDPVVAKALGLVVGRAYNFDEVMRHKDALSRVGQKVISNLSQKKGGKPFVYSEKADLSIMRLVRGLQAMEVDRQSNIFRVVPPSWDGNGEERKQTVWSAPWEVSRVGQGSPDAKLLMDGWRDLVLAYRQQDTVAWLKASEAVRTITIRLAQQTQSTDVVFDAKKLAYEYTYNRMKPLNSAMMGYAGALLGLMLSLLGRGSPRWARWFYLAAISTLWTAIASHAFGLLMRMAIMGRPPVTNLYASVIFVALAVALAALFYEIRYRNRVGMFSGSVAGCVLLWVGLRFSGEGDNLGVLVAVLDTNFWLSTHVVFMTLGYAVCVLAAMMAHGWLLVRVTASWDKARLDPLSANIRGTAYVALFFTVVGTILGGIWADQSWGRFWGWDPKENGALLIVLWLLFLTHGRLAGRLSELAFNAGMALTNIIVALAWFGVNLLGVGLHSYGFTQGAMAGLVGFIVAEMLVVCAAVVVLHQTKRRVVRV